MTLDSDPTSLFFFFFFFANNEITVNIIRTCDEGFHPMGQKLGTIFTSLMIRCVTVQTNDPCIDCTDLQDLSNHGDLGENNFEGDI